MRETIFFDLDGTLLNTLDDLAAAGNAARGQLGYAPYAVEQYRAFVGNGIPALVRRAISEHCGDEAGFTQALALFSQYYSAHSMDKTAPYPGVMELLGKLKAEGYLLGLLSNKDDANLQPIVAQFFPGIFDVASGIKPGMSAKPDPAALLAMMQQLGAAPAQCIYVGDSEVDCATALRAGVAFIAVSWGFRERAQLTERGAARIADTSEELDVMIHALLPRCFD